MSLNLRELAQHVDARIWGEPSVLLEDVAPLDAAGPNQLSYVDSRKHLPTMKTSRAGAILITESLAKEIPEQNRSVPLLFVADPQAAFITAMLLFRPQPSRSQIGISPQAFVNSSAWIGPETNVFPGAQIGADVSIGARCDIGPRVIIGDGCVIGDDCVLHPGTVLYPRVTLQDRVIVHANAVIGADGFGYRLVDGHLRKIPHTGTVLIQNDVEIGAGTTVDRGMVTATVIGRGTKLDNQVQIAHNCRLGQHNAFAAQVGLAGSVVTGDYVQCGGQVGIADHCRIGTGVRLGGQAGVMGDVSDPGNYHCTPAIPEKEAMKNYLNMLKVAELREQLKALTTQVAEIQKQLAVTETTAADRTAA